MWKTKGGINYYQISDSGSDSGWSFVLIFSLRLRNGDYQNLEIVFVLRPELAAGYFSGVCHLVTYEVYPIIPNWFQMVPPSSNLAHFWTSLDGPQGPNTAEGARQKSISGYGRLNSKCPYGQMLVPRSSNQSALGCHSKRLIVLQRILDTEFLIQNNWYSSVTWHTSSYRSEVVHVKWKFWNSYWKWPFDLN